MARDPEEIPATGRSGTWIPTAAVVVTLMASLTVPIFVVQRLEELRKEVTDVAEPARLENERLLLRFATQVSNFRGFLLTGDQSFVRRYREARAGEVETRRRLARHMPTIDGRTAPHLTRVNALLDRWHEGHEDVFAGTVSRETYVARLNETQELFAELTGELSLMQELTTRYQAERTREIDRTVRAGAIMIATLVLVGLLASMAVSRLSFRLDSYSARLERSAREEAAFRDVASGLNAAVSVADVLRQVSESAAEITRADGAYVEQIIERGLDAETAREVEVVATIGTGTPLRGTLLPYPGSLTDEILSRAEPVIATSVRDVGQAVAPYLEERCPGCELVVVPLMSEGQELGALVLLIAKPSGKHFRKGDVRRAKALGDLAAVAMRRVAILESERRARGKAEDAAEARDEILSVVSHDLRAPLTAISLSVQMLEMSEERQQEIATIREATERMERLVGDLLDTARIESGRLSIKRRETTARDLLDDAARAFAPAAANKRQSLSPETADDLPVICVDRDRIMQVFGNLLTNAIKFTPEGGTITLTATRDGSGVRFSVADSGPGIPQAALRSVFKRHWQAKKTAHLGAGLGLSIAKGIVEAHGGSIDVTNRPDGGAEFFFTIPAVDAATTT